MKQLMIFLKLSTIAIILIQCGQSNVKKEQHYSFKKVFHSKTIEGNPLADIEDSLNVIRITIGFQKNGHQQKMIKTFVKQDKGYYEQKLIGDLDNKIVDTVLILAFIPKDTSVKYIYDYNKYPPVVPEGLDDWNYIVKKQQGDEFKLTKKHFKDTMFVEEYIFDSAFKLKGINLFYGTDTLKFN